MQAQRIAALIVGTVTLMTSAVVLAQTADTPVKKKHASSEQKVAVVARPAARVTVHRRSYLDPGTETKTHEEHYQDYAFPPGDHTYTADPNDSKINWTRMPFPSCFDLAGFCR